MIIVSAKIKTKSGKRDDFIKAAQSSIAATRNESGCVGYELYVSTEDMNQLMYFEEWSGRAALDEHLNTPHMVAFMKMQKERDLVEGQVDVRVFDVKES